MNIISIVLYLHHFQSQLSNVVWRGLSTLSCLHETSFSLCLTCSLSQSFTHSLTRSFLTYSLPPLSQLLVWYVSSTTTANNQYLYNSFIKVSSSSHFFYPSSLIFLYLFIFSPRVQSLVKSCTSTVEIIGRNRKSRKKSPDI